MNLSLGAVSSKWSGRYWFILFDGFEKFIYHLEIISYYGMLTKQILI